MKSRSFLMSTKTLSTDICWRKTQEKIENSSSTSLLWMNWIYSNSSLVLAHAASSQIHKRNSRALAKRLRFRARLQKSSCLLILPEALIVSQAYSNMSTILRCRLERLILTKAMLSIDHWTIWTYMSTLLMDSILKPIKLMLNLLDFQYYSSAK
jgi:hypothetical protein